MIFEYFAKKLFSYDDKEGLKKLRANYKAFLNGFILFPLNIPGTAYYACMQGRKNVVKVIKDVFKERKQSQVPRHDFLDHLLEEVKKEGTFLTEEIAMDLVFVLLFATYETTSTAVTFATKFLADHPSTLAELTKEHGTILRSRESEESEMTWEEYKSMTFTHMIINETVRLANIAPMILRRVTKDVELKVDGRGFARFVNIRDKNGATPLHLAARQGWPECVHMLLDSGALVCASTRGYG
ncbi:Cytochrome P450 87A3 [Camellia lanceoleosa]|uniref:Cytochrome P450 87A3 n=1 Tax=Camellia lanceoleosa TaxID=1840588 RepID=A0ACC0GVJ0_9ERIC|nr:Cytochrome P450 87A3 [Camellia lanceoleosa]